MHSFPQVTNYCGVRVVQNSDPLEEKAQRNEMKLLCRYQARHSSSAWSIDVFPQDSGSPVGFLWGEKKRSFSQIFVCCLFGRLIVGFKNIYFWPELIFLAFACLSSWQWNHMMLIHAPNNNCHTWKYLSLYKTVPSLGKRNQPWEI